MDTSLTHLPENKQYDIATLVAVIRDHCPALGMIILFGSYARGDWKEAKDLAPDRKSGHPSDYDILAISEDEGDCDSLAWQDISRACDEAKLSATPRFIHHDIDYVNAKLERGHYFFSDIVAEGRLLYDDESFELAEAKALLPAERLMLVQDDFAEWFESAKQFYTHYKLDAENKWLKKGAFHLHQAAESAYKTSLLVFTGYIPDEHYLAILASRLGQVDPAFGTVFPSDNDFQRDAFTALEYAYIGARYDKRYTIDEKTVVYLAERVEALLNLTEARCREKIALLRSAVEKG